MSLISRLICTILLLLLTFLTHAQELSDTAQTPTINLGYDHIPADQAGSAISQIQSQNFNKAYIHDPVQLIQGQVAGLTITKPGGDPHEDFLIRLRGLTTIHGSSQPLIVVDGIPEVDPENIDPADISSFVVLKDASAAAIYGARAANGVILIETHTGHIDSPHKISYRNHFSFDWTARTPDVFTAEDYTSPGANVNFINLGSKADWTSAILRPSPVRQAHQLALSGQQKNSSYRFSVNYRNVQGLTLTDGFDRFNLSGYFKQKALNDRLTIQARATNSTRESNRMDNFVYYYAMSYNPTAPILGDPDNPFYDQFDGYYQELTFDYFNPVALLEQNRWRQKVNHMFGQIQTKLEILPGFYLNGRYGGQWARTADARYFPKTDLFRGRNANGQAIRGEDQRSTQYIHGGFYYARSMNNHHIQLMGGYDYQQFLNEGLSATTNDFLLDAFGFDNLGASNSPNLFSVDSRKETSKLIAFFGQAHYRFQEKLSLTASLRREGASRLGANQKWNWYPAVNAAFWLSKPDARTRFKVKAGYGKTGNLPAENYASLQILGPGNFIFREGEFIASTQVVSNANPDLAAEINQSWHIGFDGSRGTWTASWDFFQTFSSNLIYEFWVETPPNLWYNSILNGPRMRSSGMEISLGRSVIKEKNRKWHSQLLIGVSRSKLISTNANSVSLQTPIEISYFLRPRNRIPIFPEEGEQIGRILAPKVTGINGDGEWIFEDLDNDFFPSNADNQEIGNGLPNFRLSWINHFQRNRWGLDFMLRGAIGHQLINGYRYTFENPGLAGFRNVLRSSFEGEIRNLKGNTFFSDYYVENASFLRLDYINVSYRFENEDDHFLPAFVLFTGFQNLITFTSYKGVDPEVRYEANINQGRLAPGVESNETYWFKKSFNLGLRIDLK